MPYQLALRVGSVVFFMIAGQLGAGPATAGPSASTAVRIPEHDIITLFGDRGTPLAGSSQGSPGSEKSKEIKRPAPLERFTLTDGDPVSGGAALENKGIARAGEGRSLFRDLLPLLAVLAMIVAAALVVKRFLPGRRLWTGSGMLEIIARTPLSQKQSLVLVKMGRHLVLVGVTAEQINTLCLVDDPQQVAMLLGEAASEQPESMTQAFTRTLREEAGAYSHDPTERDAAAEAGTHVRGLLEKVRRFTRKREVA